MHHYFSLFQNIFKFIVQFQNKGIQYCTERQMVCNIGRKIPLSVEPEEV